MKNQITKNQHYIPRFILKGHKNENGKLYQYNKITNKEICTDAIRCFCADDYLYELKSDEDTLNINTVNLIEDSLSSIERETGRVLKNIHKKHDFLDIEKDILALFIAVQILRTREAMSFTKKFVENHTELKSYNADNFAKIFSFIQGMKEIDKTFLNLIYNFIKSKYICIFHSPENLLLSDNRPVLILRQNYKDKEILPINNEWFNNIYFPINRNICLSFLSFRPVSIFVNLDSEQANFINSHIYENSEILYSASSIKSRKGLYDKNCYR